MTPNDPWDEWSKRRGNRRDDDPFADFFGPEFEREFERMREYMNRVMHEFMKGGFPGFHNAPNAPDAPTGKPGEPFVYGFSMRMGPDGKPHFEQFGNTPNTRSPEVGQEGAREPLTDVIADDKTIAVTAELPGVDKSDINLHVADEAVTIRVDAGRKYYKTVNLPAPVVPNSANATFKNGILDLTIERKHQESDPGHRVDIR